MHILQRKREPDGGAPFRADPSRAVPVEPKGGGSHQLSKTSCTNPFYYLLDRGYLYWPPVTACQQEMEGGGVVVVGVGGC